MTNTSGLATAELLRITTFSQETIEIVRDIVTDEPEIKLCRVCGELETKESCHCQAEKKIRLVASEIIKAHGFDWMSKDVLACDDFDLQNYIFIAFHYSPSKQFMQLLQEAHISNYSECGSCHEICTPTYLYGDKESLCRRCSGEILN